MFVDERRCKRCERTLPLEAFNRYKDGHQWWCRECFKSYFRDRGRLHLEQVARSRDARRERAHEYVLGRLLASQCADCQETDPIVLEYDHTGAKAREVGALVGRSTRIDLIAAEISNCEVVCCNCHRRRTYLRRGAERTVQSAERIADRKIRRNLMWLYGYLEEARCVDCGATDPLVLEFDHIGEKRRNVSELAWTGYSLVSVKREVEKCDVRCANCHRRRTSAARETFRHRTMNVGEMAAKLSGDGPLA